MSNDEIIKENAEWFRNATRQIVSAKRIVKIKKIFNIEYIEIKRLRNIK